MEKTLNIPIYINGKYKDNIQKELKSFGISHQNLFPELDSQAKDILAQYCEKEVPKSSQEESLSLLKKLVRCIQSRCSV